MIANPASALNLRIYADLSDRNRQLARETDRSAENGHGKQGGCQAADACPSEMIGFVAMRPDGGGVRPMVMSYLTMRKCVGGIGGLLPFALLIGTSSLAMARSPP